MRKVYESCSNCENMVKIGKERIRIKKTITNIQKIVSPIFNKERLKIEMLAWISSIYLISTLYEQKSRTENNKIK